MTKEEMIEMARLAGFDLPSKPNMFIKFGEDSNVCFQSYVPKPPNSFQKWMLKIFFGIYIEVKNDY